MPADIVLLSTSDCVTEPDIAALDASIPSGKCQMSTAALNGETDITSRTAPSASRRYTLEEQLVGLNGELAVE